MTGSQPSFETQLQALGRLLDRQPATIKEVCLLQTNGGFVVHCLRATAAMSGPAFGPATIIVEPEQIAQAMAEVNAPKRGTGWLGRS